MATGWYAYRALRPDGSVSAGRIEAAGLDMATASLRRSGLRPIAINVDNAAQPPARAKAGARSRNAIILLIGELAVLLEAGLPLDRALALAVANVNDPALAAELASLVGEVREGLPLSRAMGRRAALFSPVAVAITQAGEASGTLGAALTRLAAMLEGAEDLRRLVSTAMIYPIALTLLAVAVILLMLLFVVPQFESLFSQVKGDLPFASRLVMIASRTLRDWGLILAAGLGLLVVGLRQLLSRPAARQRIDRIVLSLPQLGEVVRYVETARFARTLGVLIDGNVALPQALDLARRTIGNRHMRQLLDGVVAGVREGGGLAGPLAETGVMPRIAMGFLRTGEETSQLGPMLGRLSDVLDRDVKLKLQRLIGVLTPIITIVLGASVAGIIAAIMSAIIGFNDLAISS